MYWVEERLKQEREEKKRTDKINSAIEPLWQSLCQAMKASVNAYNASKQYGRFVPDAKNHHVFWVRYEEDTPNRNTELKKVTAVLDATERSITAKYAGIKHSDRVLAINLKDEDVTILRGEIPMSSGDAAACLLDPFLFPALADKLELPTCRDQEQIQRDRDAR
jgi:hypothetical protein